MAAGVVSVPIPNDTYKLGFIGAGKMAESIARGVVKSGVLPASRIRTAHLGSARRAAFESFGVKVFDRNVEVVKDCDVIIFSVKPQIDVRRLEIGAMNLNPSGLDWSSGNLVRLQQRKSCLHCRYLASGWQESSLMEYVEITWAKSAITLVTSSRDLSVQSRDPPTWGPPFYHQNLPDCYMVKSSEPYAGALYMGLLLLSIMLFHGFAAKEVVLQLKPLLSEKLLVSVAAGVKLIDLQIISTQHCLIMCLSALGDNFKPVQEPLPTLRLAILSCFMRNYDLVLQVSISRDSYGPYECSPPGGFAQVDIRLSPSLRIVLAIFAKATVSLADRDWAGHSRFIRVIPNTPAAVGEAASVMSLGAAATEDDGELIARLFGAIGKIWKADEKLFDAITGLSGSGPAYIYLAIEALADGGVAAGLPRELALGLASQTVLGAASMVCKGGKHPGQLKDDVASPGGTTIAGIHELEKGGFRGILMNAVVAATKRSQEFSKR
ncbi:hypothetical protein RHSIM_Rhsim03G0034800 [Rhododendron simsii]|uniref:Pyrroline-5-carboxylate reductase n=1 Tax=Rhododendron simsii TaxID=118357 RepID=A0A834LVF1_RHOSS|nr:hypothetical protein RHSIM_Rhsim03G0034800 [Rhododendron simsii]